jgi:hypothetical protein
MQRGKPPQEAQMNERCIRFYTEERKTLEEKKKAPSYLKSYH